MRITEIKKLTLVRPNSKIIFLPNKTKIRWMIYNSILINKTTKVKELGYNKCLTHFNKKQNPVFEYTLNPDNILLIRNGDKDFIYQISEKKEENQKKDVFLHPQHIKTIINGKYNKNTTKSNS